MIQTIKLFQHYGVDPYYNLAVEELLMETVPEGCCILYLWQNENTVVIGRNQNAWKECRVSLLEEDGAHLSRRLSGGGAVFHDLGNLNFTFLVPDEDYDLNRQLSVIEAACRSLGLEAARSGRNDVLVDGRKFSGNAFYHHGGKAYHHGTLLISADGEKLARYLSPSKAKLQAKGVDSVRSRVANLSEFVPGLTCDEMRLRMAEAFGAVYGLPVELLDEQVLDLARVEELRARNASREWLFGPRLPLSFECEQRFDWGSIQLQLQVEFDQIRQAKAYSDAMDWNLPFLLERALTGCRFELAAMQGAISAVFSSQPDVAQDLCGMLQAQQI